MSLATNRHILSIIVSSTIQDLQNLWSNWQTSHLIIDLIVLTFCACLFGHHDNVSSTRLLRWSIAARGSRQVGWSNGNWRRRAKNVSCDIEKQKVKSPRLISALLCILNRKFRFWNPYVAVKQEVKVNKKKQTNVCVLSHLCFRSGGRRLESWEDDLGPCSF